MTQKMPVLSSRWSCSLWLCFTEADAAGMHEIIYRGIEECVSLYNPWEISIMFPVPLLSCLPLSSSHCEALLAINTGPSDWHRERLIGLALWENSNHSANVGRLSVATVNSRGSGHLPSWLSQTLTQTFAALIDCNSILGGLVVNNNKST